MSVITNEWEVTITRYSGILSSNMRSHFIETVSDGE
jgi:hypothetical protein